jgi:hypothetical protein
MGVLTIEFTAGYYPPKPETMRARESMPRGRVFTCWCNAAKIGVHSSTTPSFLRGPAIMKNVYEVLREKEAQLHQVQMEVEALRVAAPLLSEESEAEADNNGARRAAGKPR